MKISTEWLSDLIDLDMLALETRQIADALTTVGLAVEGVERVESQTVLDIDVTTNRPDCLNHLGVARELAAYFRLPLSLPDSSEPHGSGGGQEASVQIDDPELCPRYCARLLSGVAVAESPHWLQQRLLAIGQRPINNVVDVTNYVLFELGHPLHAFDHALLEEGRIVVRRPINGEKITTLDGIVRTPDSEMLLICDASRPVAVAGVMGGADSEVSEATDTVLLESAYFNPASVRRTAKKLGLMTEASYRFERGADREMAMAALHRASRMLCDLCGASPVGPIMDQQPIRAERRQLQLRPGRIQQVIGVDVDSADVDDILNGLGFEPERDSEAITVTVPSHRVDVAIEDDLVEEVARHYGYDRLQGSYPSPATAGQYLQSETHDRFATSILEGAGFFEAYTLSFTNPAREEALFGDSSQLVPIANPITEEATHLRASLLPGLLDALRFNLNHGADNVRLFEIGRVFSEVDDSFQEDERVGLLMTGGYYEPFWLQASEPARFNHLKAVIQALGDGVEGAIEITRGEDCSYLHPGATGSVRLGDSKVGWIGQIHPAVQKRFKFTRPVFAAEFSLDAIRRQPLRTLRFEPVGRFPAVERDLSFLVDSRTEFSTIKAAVQALNIGELNDLLPIDLYQGPHLPPDKVSLTVRLVFADPTRTLTQDEVNVRTEQISRTLQDELAVEPRS